MRCFTFKNPYVVEIVALDFPVCNKYFQRNSLTLKVRHKLQIILLIKSQT